MSELPDPVEADRALKAKHRAMWAQGDYPSVAAEIIPELGPILVEACGLRGGGGTGASGAEGGGTRVLDVAAGSGNAAIPAALAGARVVASDLTPELFDAGRRLAAERGVDVEWRQADAEALPFADDEFDTVLSCVGVMFAPHHQAAADELVRVCRPGGTIGLLSWTPEGFLGQMLATMKPYMPPPPPGAQPPPLWGDEAHVRALLGDRVTDVEARKQTVLVDRFKSPEEFRDYFKARYGPTIAAYRAVADDPDRTAALDRDLAELARRHDQGSGSTAMEWEYLLFTARAL
ncbi:class I SAM-dependent methyltransferase [Streptomyces caniscabiei]|uniref:class I SAM-dependent methyltransferase n=1 Tax=Streptomyces caniscabiei TaxID=2746961 RepID=UPI0029B7CDDA|nr:class I SAM-dependent methyltransferase [Streptomyces caniscabiei]MDX2600770.1 class I SAM-dependent methyltransferase [Streptomyces caniscabiei]MDX2736649.1 class I SAM-dependent methyltransferase [Streptomyces caniscabiei]MDX2777278.1 class I SAM-dependent methyltransferase [Streptomyces caniscabiei]